MQRQVAGGLTGAPLMLCSCCITPVFQSVYESGARLGSALAVMLASPGLNPAALMLTFLLFPVSLGLARVAAALAAALLLPPILEGLFGGAQVMAPRPGAAGENDIPRSAREALERLAQALGHVSRERFPSSSSCAALERDSALLGQTVDRRDAARRGACRSVAVLLALPTFPEIPLALLFVSAGTPGAAAHAGRRANSQPAIAPDLGAGDASEGGVGVGARGVAAGSPGGLQRICSGVKAPPKSSSS